MFGASGAADAQMMGPTMLYAYEPCWFFGPSPYYYHGAEGDCCCCFRCPGGSRVQRCWTCFAWVPCFRFLIGVAPRMPENMLGGLLGLALGTHPRRHRHHSVSQSRVGRLLARPCWSLSNRSERWRRHVNEWLHERDAFEAVSQTGDSVAEPQIVANSENLTYGSVAVVREAGHFSQSDGIFNMEDYEKNECWICQNQSENWDLWMSCRHAFCEGCSGEMLRRRMPCPLCRVKSATVLRRKALNIQLSALEQRTEQESEGLLESPAPCVGPQQRNPPRARSPTLVAPQQLGFSV